jgi:hypothetical protein
MNHHLAIKLEETYTHAHKQIEFGKAVLNILDSIDFTPRLTSINNEHFYTAEELEKILKIKHNKKDQFQEFLNTCGEPKRIGITYYYSLADLVKYLPSDRLGLASLTYYCDEAGVK